ncbi:MAG: MATE family efflux transporter [Clostridiales bacterium]|nr:MATE family efflux transporter [Candidatus Cacconaster stercorequi]
MLSAQRRTEIFETMPVRQAVLRQIMPAIASQMIGLIYNWADTYFVGLLNAPAQTAAVTVSYGPFLMLTAIANLFGVGGASAIARALGQKENERARQISAMSFWLGLAVSLVFSLLFGLVASPVLALCGGKGETLTVAVAYAKWTIVWGGPVSIMSMLLANLVRAEGSASVASWGLSMGGVLNIFLDPLFILPRFLGMGAAGAGLATALSNLASVVFFLLYLLRRRDNAVLSIQPGLLRYTRQHLHNVLSVGLPSALQYALTVVAIAAQSHFVAQYATEAVAALGIIKKLDNLPIYFALGTSSGLLPLLAYNYASGNQERRRGAFRFGTFVSVGFALFCLVLYEIFAPVLAGFFIKDAATVHYAAGFLRRMVLAMPLMAACYPLIIQFQAMGKVRESLICSLLRKGVLDIPFLFLMDGLLPLYGCMWVQPIVDTIALTAALICYFRLKKKENL